MYTSLEITGFRCFKHLEIPKLARINLIGGKNNTGKTALLEALVIGAASVYAPASLLALYEMRGLPTKETFQFFSFRDLFSWAGDELRAEIAAESDKSCESFATVLEARRVSEFEVSVGEGADTGASGGLPPTADMSGLLDLRIAHQREGGEELHAHARWQGSKMNLSAEQTDPPAGTHMVPVRALGTPHEEATRYGQLQVKKQERRVESALRCIEPRLEKLESVMRGNVPVFYADLGEPPLVPIKLLGDGVHRILTIMNALCSVSHGRVLIDEIENGLHHSVMADVWRAIAKAAEDLDVQVFATTHSDECIHAAYEAVPPEDLLYHRLDRVGDDIDVVTYKPPVLEAAFETDLEVR
ncbi:MAG TPA: AAA family ATPase [Armatimonadota bacterium]|nr:AAA family ATPase [Armatimonadota bacterium]